MRKSVWNLRVVVCFACLVVSAVGAAGEIALTVTNELARATVNANADTLTLTADTPKDTAYPSGLADPAFWFDALETNGWSFVQDGDTLRVTAIPSKTGARTASTDPAGGNFKKWTLIGPAYVTGTAAKGVAAAVDFGATGSKCGLVFDPVGPDGARTNVLENIGTVVAVFDARQGGGMLLGGGEGRTDPDNPTSWYNEGAMWLRGDSSWARKGYYDYWNPVTRGSAHNDFKNSAFRYDGWPGQGSSTDSFANAWDVISVICASNRVPAAGISLGDIRYNSNSSGGQRIAEMLIFDRVLSVDDVSRLERWLHQKWFGRPRVGTNGRAELGTLTVGRNDWVPVGATVPVNVPAGETLTLYRNQHGYGGTNANATSATHVPAFEKTGAGTFALADAANFQGVVRLREGRLELPQRPVPTALPEGAFLHFDASQGASCETSAGTDGKTYLDVWRNLATENTIYGEQIVARAPSDTYRPEVLANELGTGLDILDFGTNGTVAGGARFLQFTTNAVMDAPPAVYVQRMATVVALVGAQCGGGNLLEPVYAARSSSFTDLITTPLAAEGVGSIMGSVGYLNGVPVDPSVRGYENAGYQVVALRCTRASVKSELFQSRYLQRRADHAGGGRLGEVAVYLRALTDDELHDASAYLMRKWLGRTAPGYAPPAETTVPTLQNLACEGGEIYVPAGETVTVGRLSADRDFVKTGGGTLLVQNLSLAAGVRIVVRDGAVRRASQADVSAKCEVAAAPSLRLDASDAARLDCIEDGDGVLRVRTWRDRGERGGAFLPQSYVSEYAPRYVAASADGPNGLAYLDFGTSALHDHDGRGLSLAPTFLNVRAAYAVCRVHPADGNAYPHVFSADESSRFHGDEFVYMPNFLRQSDAFCTTSHGIAACVRAGSIYTNGLYCTYKTTMPTDVWMVLEFHPSGGTYVSSVGIERSLQRCGGFELGELLLYERPLSARERCATCNYLMKKWLGKTEDELADLPDAPTPAADLMTDYVVSGTAACDCASDASYANLIGNGTLAKTGAGELVFGDWSGFTGTVSVATGAVRLTKRPPTADDCAAAMPTQGLIYRADAGAGVSLVTNDDLSVSVTSWKNVADANWTGLPLKDGIYASYLTAPEFGGRPVVDMGRNQKQAFVFAKDGVRTPLEGVRSALWLIGSQNSGGFLLGGGTNAHNSAQHYNFHRGIKSDSVYDPAYTLVNTHAQTEVKEAVWRLNGVGVDPQKTGLSGDWDILSMNMRESAEYPVQVEGFAFDGRTLDSSTSFDSRIGNQRLAEVLLYNRRLSSEEIAAGETYLRYKWRFGVQGAPAEGVAVELGAEGVLDCGGYCQQVASLVGSGTVTNGSIAARHLVADGAAAAVLTVEGAFKILPGLEIELENVFASGPIEDWIVIPALVASELDTTAAGLDDIAFTGDVPAARYQLKAVYDAQTDVLGVRVTRLHGTTLIFR